MKNFSRIANTIMVLSCCFIFISIITTLDHSKGIVQNGKIDVRNIDDNAVIKMKGTWGFYWNQLVSQEGKIGDTGEIQFVPVPSEWSSYRDVNHERRSVFGYATYKVVIRGTIGDHLALKLPQIGSAYRLWIDGKVRFSSGQVGRNEESSKPKWTTKVVGFDVQSEQTEILLEISNYHYFRSGITNQIMIGKEGAIQSYTYHRLFSDIMIFAALLIMFVFFILIFFIHHNKTYIYLALFSAAVSLRPLLYGEVYFNSLFPNINFQCNTKLYFVNFIVMPLLYSYLYHQYNGVLNGRYYKMVSYPFFLILLAGLLVPVKYMNYPVIMLEALIPVFTWLCIYLLYKAYQQKKTEIRINMISVVLLFVLSIVDILNNMKKIDLNLYYIPIGLLLIAFVQAFLQFCKFRENTLQNIELVRQMDIKNLNIEQETRQRYVAEKLNSGLRTIISKLEFEDLLVNILDNLYQIVECDETQIALNIDHKYSFHAVKLKDNNTICTQLEGEFDFRKFGFIDQGQRTLMFSVNEDENDTTIFKPLYHKDNLFCVIKIRVRRKEEDLMNDLQVIELYCDECALVLKNAMSYKRIKELAMLDELTMIYNRRYLLKRGAEELHRDNGTDFGVIMMDIDHFKKINDNYGHLFGDDIIKSVADICKSCMPENSVIGRYGGEEFIIFLKNIKLEGILALAEKFRIEVEKKKYVSQNDIIKITISIGIAMRQRKQDLYQVIHKADNALYEAKSAGRNCIRVADHK